MARTRIPEKKSGLRKMWLSETSKSGRRLTLSNKRQTRYGPGLGRPKSKVSGNIVLLPWRLVCSASYYN